MPKPKTKSTSKKKSAQSKKQPTSLTPTNSDPAADDYDPIKGRLVLQQLEARHGQVDKPHCEAFDSLIDDEHRAELGAKTRAPGVLRDAIAWAVIIDHAFQEYPAMVEQHYAKARYQYFLHRLGLLDTAISAQEAQRGGQGDSRSTAADREQAARDARKALISKMRTYAGARKAERDDLEKAMGTTESSDALGTSIQSLATLARTWISRPDTQSQILCAAAGLVTAVVDDVVAAGKALTSAAGDATMAGRMRAFDAPAVNLAEGAVLFEMSEAARCFDEAHEATQVIPRLSPGAATRHVLGSKKSAAKSASTDQEVKTAKAAVGSNGAAEVGTSV